MTRFDVIVVGAGHAGIEAALSAARMGLQTACITMRLDRIGHLPCNCSIGGPAKGHIAREVDALGGQMGRTTDRAMTHLRRVGTGKGPAVQTARAHVCKDLYPLVMQEVMGAQANLTLIEGIVERGHIVGGRVAGVWVGDLLIECRSLVLTTGTFLNGVCHQGHTQTSAARHGDAPSIGLSGWLAEVGVRLRRFKTGTTPRIAKSSIDFTQTESMESEPDAGPFSFSPLPGFRPLRDLLPCWQTHTNDVTHEIIRGNLQASAMYGGAITGVGPRYCPSIEDKIVRFADKTSHPIWLEQETWDGESFYVQGTSTSLPADVQQAFLETIPGLQNVKMLRPGYAVEYDMADPLQLTPSLMSKLLPGLFLAGQVNGTSGYEEAAGQGLVAGINAARFARDEAPLEFARANSFIGVMIDDLVTKGVEDPYRMLTARAEHRLLLRHDNADARLTPIAYELGLCDEQRWSRFTEKRTKIGLGEAALHSTTISSADNPLLAELGQPPVSDRISLFELMKRPQVTLDFAVDVAARLGRPVEIDDDAEVREQLGLAAAYDGYIQKQTRIADQSKRLEGMRIPGEFDYSKLSGLSFESKDKLGRIRPTTVGQASRVPGVRPSDIALLIGHLRAN